MSHSRDGEIARFAAAQHAIVTTAQLRDAGLTSAAVSKRVRTGRLHRLHQGVYAVGAPASSREAFWMAAVLACGPGAVLSHRSAAALWDLLRPMEGPIDVSVPSQNGRRRRPGIRIHRCPSLRRGALTRRHLIPVTTPRRTIEDLRNVVSPQLHRRAIRQAEVQRFALGPRTRGDRTRSDLERDFLDLCERFGLPRPEVNVKLGRWEVDFLWRAQRVAVETDTWRYHGGSVAFEDDHKRDLDLRTRGLTVHRFTEDQLLHEPDLVAADLATALSDGPSAALPALAPRPEPSAP
ncbi:MAG TPA: type IV toxin-antitoxin system AbiEi family antitoxin domain-containing protein [Solirubrobacterales bacterium]|nr:type IV toxin-antitoxin system AbiEi family antitoxin domain-containing protein [Solirubrobacterales bacterium]